jgi:hypothetical protein
MSPNTPCNFYFATGKCKYGQKCKLSHDKKNYKKRPCAFYQKGLCKFGSRCSFLHENTTLIEHDTNYELCNALQKYGTLMEQKMREIQSNQFRKLYSSVPTITRFETNRQFASKMVIIYNHIYEMGHIDFGIDIFQIDMNKCERTKTIAINHRRVSDICPINKSIILFATAKVYDHCVMSYNWEIDQQIRRITFGDQICTGGLRVIDEKYGMFVHSLELVIWDLEKANKVQTIPLYERDKQNIGEADILTDGAIMCTLSCCHINVAKNQYINLTTENYYKCVLAVDDRRVLLSHETGLEYWNLRTRTCLKRVDTDQMILQLLHLAKNTILWLTADSITVWNIQAWERVYEYNGIGLMRSISFLGGNEFVISTHDEIFRLTLNGWIVSTKRMLEPRLCDFAFCDINIVLVNKS